jgi:hypothetical protein
VAVGVADQRRTRAAAQIHRVGRDKGCARLSELRDEAVKVVNSERQFDMGKVVGFRVDWRRPPGRRGAIFEELHARPAFRRRTQAGDPDDGAERPVQALLGRITIDALVSELIPSRFP